MIHFVDIVTKDHRILDMLEKYLVRDESLSMQIIECVLHHDLSFLFSCLDDGIQMADISIHDDISCRISIDEYFSCNNISPIFSWKHDLSNNSIHHQCELDTNLRLHIPRKCIDQAVKGLDHVIGMERWYHEMSRLSKSEDCGDCLLISHLTHHDDIWILSHGIPNRLIECHYMFSDLFLMDQTFLILDDIFDWIFDGDDMFSWIFIQIIEHCNHGRSFSTSRTSRDQDQSAIAVEQSCNALIQPNWFGCWYLLSDGSESNSNTIHILGDIRTKTGSLIIIYKVNSMFLRLYSLASHCIIHKLNDLDDVIIAQDSEFFDRVDLSTCNTYIWILIAREMRIRNRVGDNLFHKGTKPLSERRVCGRIHMGNMSDISPIVSNVSKKNKRIAFMGKIFILYFSEYGFFYTFSLFLMHFALGTTNTPKSSALSQVLTLYPSTKRATILNHRVPSWVPDMPTTLEELRNGAKNRAIQCRNEIHDADYFVGMEWWVYQDSVWGEYWLVWVSYIEDRAGKWYYGYSCHLQLPRKIVELLFDGGKRDLEQIVESLYGEASVGDKEWSFWLFSEWLLPRSDSFVQATKAALVPHFSQYYQ